MSRDWRDYLAVLIVAGVAGFVASYATLALAARDT